MFATSHKIQQQSVKFCHKSKKNDNNLQHGKEVWNWSMLATTTNNDYGIRFVLGFLCL